MGEAAKKLIGWTDPETGEVHKGWAHYEFGKAIGDIPGNCFACRKRHRELAVAQETSWQEHRRRAAEIGHPIPLKRQFDKNPPCQKCPKWKLFPSNWGLDPANTLAVHIYRMASAEHRVGVFSGAILMRTVAVEDVKSVMDEYGHAFPTWLHRLRTFEAIMGIDRVATEIRSEAEEAERKARKAADDSKSKRRKT